MAENEAFTAFFDGGQSDDGNSKYRELLIGCGLAVGGNMLISVSLNLQKYTHMQDEERQTRHYLRSPLWWLGLLLMIVGEIGNFSAYGFAPASLVAPLGSSTVIANMFIAVIFLKESLRPEDIFGCAFAVMGAFLLVTFAAKDEVMLDAKGVTSLLIQPAFLVYASLVVVGLVVLLIMRYKFKVTKVLVLLMITASLASFTVIAAKACSSMLQLTISGRMQLGTAVFWIMLVVLLVTALLQVKFLNMAMKDYDSTTVVPTNFVLFTISAILAGVIFYKEFWGLGPLNISMFLFGCLLCFVGVYFITAGRNRIISVVSTQAVETPTEPPTTPVIRDIFPSWLFSNMNQTPVQPRRENYMTTHERTVDRRPIMRRVDTDTSSDDECLNVAAPPAGVQRKTPGRRKVHF